MGDGANGVHSPDVVRLVVVESGGGQDAATTHHLEMEKEGALEPQLNNRNATPKHAVSI